MMPPDQEERRGGSAHVRVLDRASTAYAVLLGEESKRELERLRRSRDLSMRAAHLHLLEVRRVYPMLAQRLSLVQSSKWWHLRNGWFALKRRLGVDRTGPLPDLEVPPIAKLESIASDAYQQWRGMHVPRTADLERMRRTIGLFSYKPTISIIMPTYETPLRYLRDAIDSVLAQIYPHWELCIADDASPSTALREALEEYAALDPRVKLVLRTENGHISRASNSALAVATGEFVGFLDHDDVLAPHALYEVAAALNEHPDVDMLYSDEDKVNDEGLRIDPYFKPAWSPETFLTQMYTAHFSVYRRALVEAVGGLRPEFDGSQDWDLALRITERTDRIHHIPDVLYSWRIHSGSAASGTAAKPYAYDAALRAIEDALHRRGEPAVVGPAPNLPAGSYRVRFQLPTEPPRIEIIIPTRDLALLLGSCLSSIFERSTYANFRVTVVDNGSRETNTAELFAYWGEREPERFRVLPLDVPFNYSLLNNHAVAATDAPLLLFLNNDTQVISADWLEAMAGMASRPAIGAVGALLSYDDDTVQHAGVILGIGGVAGHSHRHNPIDSGGHYNRVALMTNYSAVTAACLMVRKSSFEAAGGFDETLPVAFNDVDFCLRLMKLGLRNVYVPDALLYHFESKSRGYEDTPEKERRFRAEAEMMHRRWHAVLDDDPYYSIHHTRVREQFGLRVHD